MKKFLIDYDAENDSLLIFKSGKKAKHSIEIFSDIIIDFYDNEVVGIEILNASKNLGASKVELRKIRKVEFNSFVKNDKIVIIVLINFRNKRVEQKLEITEPIKI